MTPMVDELGWTRADFTLTRSIGQLVMAFVGVLVGSRVDRFGGRPIMLIGNTILVSALLAHSYINTLWEWLFLNGVVMTVGCAMIGNLVVNVTLSKWFVINRGKAVAWAAMGVSFGGIVLTPLATWLIDTQGWREAWLWLVRRVLRLARSLHQWDANIGDRTRPLPEPRHTPPSPRHLCHATKLLERPRPSAPRRVRRKAPPSTIIQCPPQGKPRCFGSARARRPRRAWCEFLPARSAAPPPPRRSRGL